MGNNTLSSLSKIASAVLLCAGILVAAASSRLFFDGHRHFKEASRLLDAGDRPMAVVELESAAKAYVPGSPYVKRALRELSILAKGAEMRGDVSTARHIWEVVRRSILATRHFYQPNFGDLETAEHEIRRLVKSGPKADFKKADPTARPNDPSAIASILLFVGVLGWIGGAAALLSTSKRAQLFSLKTRAMSWIACIGGLFLWIVMSWVSG